MMNKLKVFIAGLLLIIVALIGHQAGVGAGVSAVQSALATSWTLEIGGKSYNISFGHPAVAQAAGKAAPDLSVIGDAGQVAWALDLLAELHNDQPSVETVAYLVAWQRAEGGSAQFNPLNTTQDEPAASNYNEVGVKNYQTRQDGLDATVRTLGYNYPGYSDLHEGLRLNDPERALMGLYASPWGTIGANTEAIYRQLLAQISTPLQANDMAIRQALVDYAISLQGIPYISGGRSASGGDCSGTMQWVYMHVTGIDIGSTTFSQMPNLKQINARDVLPGDLWYGQYPDDQHTGMVADVNGDGRWDLINNGGLQSDMHVDLDFMENEYFSSHTIGFYRAL